MNDLETINHRNFEIVTFQHLHGAYQVNIKKAGLIRESAENFRYRSDANTYAVGYINAHVRSSTLVDAVTRKYLERSNAQSLIEWVMSL